MNFKKVITIFLISIFLFSTFVGCKKIDDVETSVASNTSNVTYSDIESDDESSTDITSDDASSTDDIEQVESSDDSDTTSTDTSSTVSEPNIIVNSDGSEIYGSGTADDPYIDFPDADKHTVNTLKVPAGKSIFYNIARVGGRIFTINDANVYVVCDGTKYTAKNGVLSFKVIDALASDAITFEIGNTSSADKTYTITFTDLEGSMSNPAVVTNVGSKITVNLEEGNEIGYFYKHIATQNGVLKLYLLIETEKGILIATNNRNSAQRSTESTDEGEVKTDATGTYVELEVEKGDEIVINTGSKPNKRGKYPAITIEWMLKY